MSVDLNVGFIGNPFRPRFGLHVLDSPCRFVRVRLHPLLDGVVGQRGISKVFVNCLALGDARVSELLPALLALVALMVALHPDLDDLAAVFVRAFDCVGYGL